jgi:hypothetical protein
VRILVAEDDPVSRAVRRATLARLGHEVIEASDGLEALAVLEREPVPVLITDWVMPDLSGVDLCRAIREAPRPHYTYVILLTAPHRTRLLPSKGCAPARTISSRSRSTRTSSPHGSSSRADPGTGAPRQAPRGAAPDLQYCKKIKSADLARGRRSSPTSASTRTPSSPTGLPRLPRHRGAGLLIGEAVADAELGEQVARLGGVGLDLAPKLRMCTRTWCACPGAPAPTPPSAAACASAPAGTPHEHRQQLVLVRA